MRRDSSSVSRRPSLASRGHRCTDRDSTGYAVDWRSFERTRGARKVSEALSGHHAHGFANAGDEPYRRDQRDSRRVPQRTNYRPDKLFWGFPDLSRSQSRGPGVPTEGHVATGTTTD